MAPKAAQKTPTTGGKAPAGKAPAEKKEAGKKTAAPSGDKKKRTKSRKETYSSYIYKGTCLVHLVDAISRSNLVASSTSVDSIHQITYTDASFHQFSSRSTLTPVSPTAPCLS